MQCRIKLEPATLSTFSTYAGDFVELFINKNVCILASELNNLVALVSLEVLQPSNEDGSFSIRFRKSLINELSIEESMEISILEDVLQFKLFNKFEKFMYSRKMSKQSGYIDIASKLQLISHINEYPYVTTGNIYKQCSMFAKLGLPMTVMNNTIFAEYNNSVFCRSLPRDVTVIPNFSTFANDLKSLIKSESYFSLVQNYIYCNVHNKIHVFLSKRRLPASNITTALLGCKFQYNVSLDITNLLAYKGKAKLSEDCTVVLDVNTSTVKITYADGYDSEIAVDVTDKASASDIINADDLDSAIESFNASSNSIDTQVGYPRIKIPVWILNKSLLGSHVKIMYNSTTICLSLNTGCGALFIPFSEVV